MAITIYPTVACNYSCEYCGNLVDGKKASAKIKTMQQWKDHLEQLDRVLKLGGSRIKEICFNGGEPTLVSWFNKFCNWILIDKKWILTIYTNLSDVESLSKLPESYRLIIRATYHHSYANPLEFAVNWMSLNMKYRIHVSELGVERKLEKYVNVPKKTMLHRIYETEQEINRADTLRIDPKFAIYLTCWEVMKANMK